MAYPSEGQSPIKAVTACSAIESFDQVIGRVESLVSRACGAADRFVGSRPTAAIGAEKVPTQQHLIAQIQQRRDRLVDAVDQLESELTRIESAL